MTDVELSSTVPSSRSSRWLRRAAVLGGAVVTVLSSTVLVVAGRAAVADPIGSAQAQADQITAQLTQDQQHLDAVSQQYDGAQVHEQQIAAQMTQLRATVVADKTQVVGDQDVLRQEAVNAYMRGSTDDGMTSLFSTGAEQASAADEYQSVASGNLSGAVDALGLAQVHLATEQEDLQTVQDQAQAVLTEVSSARQEAQSTVAAQEALLSQVQGQIATLVAQRQAAEAAAAHAQFEARLAASASSSSADGSGRGNGGDGGGRGNGGDGGGATMPNLPAAGGAARAVEAAESQIGVPYVWGGETPGVGFDCSGLAQWSWEQAGVSLPRTAAAQYDAIPHIPLSDLEPGDLVFWAYGGGVSHVGMYVGNGDIVDAPQTGQDVQIQPIWGDGLVGAGRP